MPNGTRNVIMTAAGIAAAVFAVLGVVGFPARAALLSVTFFLAAGLHVFLIAEDRRASGTRVFDIPRYLVRAVFAAVLAAVGVLLLAAYL
ncbi:MAG: hypothetical protein IIY92_00090 [Lachnospiraceae bacterium]|nr:hypothetical protein [Lachnospiraceae bacterium]